MLDANGKLIRPGDRVAVNACIEGVVVFSIDTDEFTPDFPKRDWDYLGGGIMVQTDRIGLMRLVEGDEDFEVIVLGTVRAASEQVPPCQTDRD
jgi:hypothetical protein